MDKNIRNIYIDSPASTSGGRCNQVLSGTFFVPNSIKTEIVKIAIAISRRDHQRSVSEWLNIISRKSPTRHQANFLISKENWQNHGLVWVVESPIFESTPIKIVFDKNTILEPGFRVEIFSRDSIIVREVPPNNDLASGASVSFTVSWKVASNTADATPTVEPTAQIR